MEPKKMESDSSHPSGDDSAARSGSEVPARKLGTRQWAVLNMMNPEWICSVPGKPDAVSLRILESLEARGYVYRNSGRWTISQAGRDAIADAINAAPKEPQ